MPPSRIVEKAPLYRQTYRGVGYTSLMTNSYVTKEIH